MSDDIDEEFQRMQRWLGAHNEDKPKPEEGLTVEQTKGFAQRGGWLLLWCVIALMGVLAWSASRSAPIPNVATITLTAPTTHTDGSPIAGALSYDLYQGIKGGSKIKVGTITATGTTITTGLAGGVNYCWDIVANEAGNTTPSDHSAEACKAFPLATPNVVVITVT